MRLFVLLALVGCCVADYLMQVNLVPKLLDEQLAYSIEAICAKNKMVVRAYSNNSQLTYDSAQLNLSNTMCPDGYQITVALRHKNNDKNSQLIYVWPTSYVAHKMPNNFISVHLINFANYFKLKILPMAGNSTYSKMVYRVNVYCAGKERVEFKTYTQSETMVVFNTVQRKCEKYDVKVWPIRKEWMQIENTLRQPEFNKQRITVKNGETYQINFANHFNLAISPPLAPNCGQVYSVEVKCYGREAQKYRTFTEANAQIVLNAIGCTEYDIYMWKLDKKMVQNAKNEEGTSSKNVTSRMNLSVQIKNGDTYLFYYIDDQQPPPVESVKVKKDPGPKRSASEGRNLKRMLTQNDVDDHLLTPSKLQKLENELAAITQQDEEDIQRIFDDIEKVKIQVNSLVNDVEGLKKFVSNSATEINKYMEQKFN
ncbi:hypothetical protein GPALN_005896 [Globodera pallida]|nr:hypothetical protein GPALN_005896 [Globodera pallida]